MVHCVLSCSMLAYSERFNLQIAYKVAVDLQQ